MAEREQLITCIYCRQHRPPSSEHLLARSLGGNETEPITCEHCNNTTLSKLDQAIAERSLVALSRVAYTPRDSFNTRLGGDHFHYDAYHDMHQDVTLANGFKLRLFPQMHFRKHTNQVVVISDDATGLEQLLALIGRHVCSDSLDGIHVKVGPPERCSTARIVGHRTNDCYIRAATLDDAELVRTVLASHWSELRSLLTARPAPTRTLRQPTVHVTLGIVFDDIYRAVAKTAFNVFAALAGAEVALRSEYDPIRTYVLGDVRYADNRQAGELAYDDRFVRRLRNGRFLTRETDEHTILILPHSGRVLAWVTLYGQHAYLVHIGPGMTSRLDIAGYRFSTDRTQCTKLDVEAIYHLVVSFERWQGERG